jgi:hypothetical protein
LIRRLRSPVQRTRSGTYRLELDQPAREMVRRLLMEMRELLVADPADPRVRRLFPTAYHADPERDAEYQRLMREELVTSRLAAIDAVDEVLGGTEAMSPSQANAFVQSLNALRLVLGTILDVDEVHDSSDLEPGDPLLAEHHLYDFLSWLLDSAVRAMSGG